MKYTVALCLTLCLAVAVFGAPGGPAERPDDNDNADSNNAQGPPTDGGDASKQCKGATPHRPFLPPLKKKAPCTFDFIVVGGGAAGCAIAARLSENPNWNVALIEAGKATHSSLGGTDFVAANFGRDSNGNFEIRRPFTREDVPLYSGTVRAPQHPFFNITQNEPTSIFPGSQSSMALGGSQTHNNMVWIRSTKEHINSWNLNGWSYDEVLPFYKKSENVTGSLAAQQPTASTYHGFNGEINIVDPVAMDPIAYKYVNSCIATGLPRNDDFNGPTRKGCGFNSFNIKNGIRASTAEVMLSPAMSRPNLFVYINAPASKLVVTCTTTGTGALAKKTCTTTGVTFVQDGVSYTFGVDKEVVVSCGAFKTPQLLMLSGIGPKDVLTQAGVTTLVASPHVGKNFLYQHSVFGSWQYLDSNQPSLYGAATEALNYANTKTGVFASTGIWGWAFYNTPDTTIIPPSLYVFLYSGGTNSKSVTYVVTNALPYMKPGNVTIADSNPNTPPVVTTNTYADPRDKLTLVYAINKTREIFSRPPLNSIQGTEIGPGLDKQSNEQILAWLDKNAKISAHLFGTTKIANTNSVNDGVVNTKLQVNGVAGLRVADTSVIPNLDCHSQATVVMIAERVADFIKTAYP